MVLRLAWVTPTGGGFTLNNGTRGGKQRDGERGGLQSPVYAFLDVRSSRQRSPNEKNAMKPVSIVRIVANRNCSIADQSQINLDSKLKGEHVSA